MKKFALFLILLAASAFAQNAALMPVVRQQFFSAAGVPLAGGFVFTYAAGTTNQLATYTDSSGTSLNSNPVVLDSAGMASIWLGPNTYDIVVQDSTGAQLYAVNNVSDVGLLAMTRTVLLSPVSGGEQDVAGPLGATFFVGTQGHTTSPGVRVAALDPNTVLDTNTNPPSLITDTPALPGQLYHIPDPGVPNSHMVMSGGTGPNDLDCTQGTIVCKRTAYIYFEEAGCNNATSGLGWDTFGTNSPTPICITGTNIQKGVMAFPAAVTYIQENSASCAASLTCTTTYPAATVAGNLLEVEIAVDGSKTVSTVSDGTNSYTKAVGKTQGALDVEIWYFNGNSASKAAATTLTVTYSGGTPNSAIHWKEYNGTLTSGLLDVTASNSSASSTAVTSGTTAGTAQATELVLAAVGTVGNASIVGQNGFVKHLTVSQSTNVSIASEGAIQQTTATQSGSFTLGAAELWASVIATFKANVAATITAQRGFVLPGFFSTSTTPVGSSIKWQNPLAATGTINVQLGAAVVCTQDGSTDDPVFNTAATASALVSATGPNIITNTPLTPLVSTGCVSGNAMHFQIQRLRYNIADSYEGYVYVNGGALSFGITQ